MGTAGTLGPDGLRREVVASGPNDAAAAVVGADVAASRPNGGGDDLNT